MARQTATTVAAPTAPAVETVPAVAPRPVKAAPTPDNLRGKYEELARQSTAANKKHDYAEIERLKPLKAAAFQAWRNSLRPTIDAQREKDQRRRY